MASTEAPQTKGGSLIAALEALEESPGHDYLQRLLGRVPEDLRTAWERKSIMPNTWYPLAWDLAVNGAHRELSGGNLAAVEDLGYRSSMKNFNGIYRVFFKLVKPQTLLAKAGNIFGKFYSQGRFEMLDARDGFARARIISPGFDECEWVATSGGCRAALEVCGARNVRLKYESGGVDHSDEAVIAGTWT